MTKIIIVINCHDCPEQDSMYDSTQAEFSTNWVYTCGKNGFNINGNVENASLHPDCPLEDIHKGYLDYLNDNHESIDCSKK